ncbi:MAG TPA: Rieske (2Fe-2S) protein [Roseiflexaceae bacterium]|nr:Rieske (2Fe-2S) protein [Roseiflexaceae bacterium]
MRERSWIFYTYATASGAREAQWAADRLLAIGVAAAAPTALAGVADFSTIKEDAAALGAAHALLNTAGLGLFLASLWARTSGSRGLGVLLSSAGLAVVTGSAILGGDLTYRKRVGVNHTPPADGPREWTAAIPLERLGDHAARRVMVADVPVLLYRDGDQVYAIGAVCSHAGGPLEEGEFQGGCVQCPWHQSVFDLRTGAVVHGPATHAQPAYEARVRGGQVEVRLARSGDLEDAPQHERAVSA